MLIISHKSKKEFTDFLDSKNIKYLKTIDNPNIDKRISDHPDLSLFKLWKKIQQNQITMKIIIL